MPKQKQELTVLITTSGIGSKLGELTTYTNKALVKIGRKPALSYIIESYPKNTHFVITLGHFGEHVKEFISLVYPNISVTFVPVKTYSGKGSSLAHSMLSAKKHLQKPFIYHASDTIVHQKIPLPIKNWAGGYVSENSSQYASFTIADGVIQYFSEKGNLNPDYLHIGLVGIFDYKLFWKCAIDLYAANPEDESLSDVDILQQMLERDTVFTGIEFNPWYDVGNVDSLNAAREAIHDSFHILDKPSESIYLFKTSVVKFFSDTLIAKNRVRRARALGSLVPPIEGSTAHFYKYKYAKGDLLASVITPATFPHFLNWAFSNVWKPEKEVSAKRFQDICYDFYYTKTIKRTQEFLKTRNIKDSTNIINGETVPSLAALLKKVDFDWLADTQQTSFHGDFIPDNIIKTAKGYTLLDWRQDFGGLIRGGDMYYDLAKLNHNLVINHEMINYGHFNIDRHKNVVTCDIFRSERLVECQEILKQYIIERGLDIRKIDILTPILWLNMSPLHSHPYDLFLYYFGKLQLFRALNNEKHHAKEGS
ncbi:MAG: hypothetical protein K8Q97_00200 [Candidatus Andersenbacteria bacterium]|nr:hypothetical protein [Candidatus Andersenbacteria bacterium]